MPEVSNGRDCLEETEPHTEESLAAREGEPWEVVLPTFFAALVIVPLVLYVVAKVAPKYWVEFASGISGHVIGFRWLEGVMHKIIGTTHFHDIFISRGFTGLAWTALDADDEGIDHEFDHSKLYNSTTSGWKQMLNGSEPELVSIYSRVIGNVNTSWQNWTESYAESIGASHIGGYGEDPATDNPWCFFLEQRNRFICYVGESFQYAVPLFWRDEGKFADQVGQRVWQMLVYGLLWCAALCFMWRC